MMQRRTPDAAPPQPNFDRVARLYRFAEYLALGPILQRTRTALLLQLPSCSRALVLGDGDGRFLVRLLERCPGLHVLAVDTSAAMLRLLRTRCRTSAPRTCSHLRTLQASALEIMPARDTGLVVTHFFLDCLSQPDVDRLVRDYASRLQPQALWLLSDFAQPARSWVRPFAAVYVRALYFAFRLLTGLRVTHLPDPQRALRAAGFERLVRRERLGGLLYTELWKLGAPASVSVRDPKSLSRETTMQPFTQDDPPKYPEAVPDPLPNPEPPVPPLSEPDPGVFHHSPAPDPVAPPHKSHTA